MLRRYFQESGDETVEAAFTGPFTIYHRLCYVIASIYHPSFSSVPDLVGQGARAVVRKYQKTLEEERTRIEKTEAERLRMRAATTRLLQRVDGLERRAEEEAAQVKRGSISIWNVLAVAF